MTVGTLLRLLFSVMFLLVIGLLLQPIWSDLQQRNLSERVVQHARAASAICTAHRVFSGTSCTAARIGSPSPRRRAA